MVHDARAARTCARHLRQVEKVRLGEGEAVGATTGQLVGR